MKVTKKIWALTASAIVAVGGATGYSAYQEKQKQDAAMERNKELFLCADEMLDSRFTQTGNSGYFKRIHENLETTLSNEKNIRSLNPSSKHTITLDSTIGAFNIRYDEAKGTGSFMAFEDKKNFSSDLPRRLQVDIQPSRVSVDYTFDATDDGTKPHYGAWLKQQPNSGQSHISFRLNNLSGTAQPENVSVQAVDADNAEIARETVQSLTQEWNKCAAPTLALGLGS